MRGDKAKGSLISADEWSGYRGADNRYWAATEADNSTDLAAETKYLPLAGVEPR
jgi:hypothetical protein